MITPQQYQELIDRHPDVELKGKNMLYTSLNGHMFSQINKTGEFGIRLSKEDGEEFIAKHNSGPFMSYGAVMRGYVRVPDEVFADTEELDAYFKKSISFIKMLDPK